MKTLLLVFIAITSYATHAISQGCAGFGEKIQSSVCTKPTDAKIIAINCNTMAVEWKGNSGQTYLVTGYYKDTISNKIIRTIAVTDVSCNISNTCTAIIPALPGIRMTWSVQAECVNVDRTFYSYILRSENDILIPTCSGLPDKTDINVFPNPSMGKLSIDITADRSGAVQFIIHDIMGKVVFTKNEIVDQGVSSNFDFHLPDLLSGIYLIEAKIGGIVISKKFVIEK